MKCPYCNKEVEFVLKQKVEAGKWFCSECNSEIPANVKEWSEANLGVALCFDCQKKAKAKQEG